MPSMHICSRWIVNAWDKLAEKLVKKSWDMEQCKSVENVSRESKASRSSDRQIVTYSKKDTVAEIAPLIDEDDLRR